MINAKPAKKDDPITFAHNWVENMDSVIQLLLSDAIWQRKGFNSNDPVKVSRRRKKKGEDHVWLIYYLNDEPVMLLSKSFGKNDIPLHYILCI